MAPIKPVLTSWANGSDYAKLDGSFCELTLEVVEVGEGGRYRPEQPGLSATLAH